MSTYFNASFPQFFKDLAGNNTQEWFNDHRKVYEKEVKAPFAAFVGEMIERIKQHEPDIMIKPADAITRINRDIRFSKDKAPYNTHVAANISLFGKKDKSYPGFFFQFSHDQIKIFGGAYMVETPMLYTIRKFIAHNPEQFSSAYGDPGFIEKFGEVKGDKHKRVPEEFQALAVKEPRIANKEFYYSSTLEPDLLLRKELPDQLMEHYTAGKKLNDFLKSAIKS